MLIRDAIFQSGPAGQRGELLGLSWDLQGTPPARLLAESAGSCSDKPKKGIGWGSEG